MTIKTQTGTLAVLVGALASSTLYAGCSTDEGPQKTSLVSLEHAGDGFLEGDEDRTTSSEEDEQGQCDQGELAPAPGYAFFSDPEFSSDEGSVVLKVAVEDGAVPEGANFRAHVSVSTELEQHHLQFDVPAADVLQGDGIEIPFEDLKLADLKEETGTLAFSVFLESEEGRTPLRGGSMDNAVGFHLKFHQEGSGNVRAYLPELLETTYAQAWQDAEERRIELHAASEFPEFDDPGGLLHDHMPLAERGITDRADLTAEEHDLEHPGDVEDAADLERMVQSEALDPGLEEAINPAEAPPTLIVSEGYARKALVPGLPKNVRFCPKMNTEFVDAGVGEDYWTTPSLHARPMYGAMYKVYDGTSLEKTGYLEESDGCTDLYLPINKTYRIEVWAKAKIWGNTYRVRNKAGQTRYKSYSLKPTSTSLKTFAPNLTDSAAQERWNIFGALIRSGRKHGVGSGTTYNFDYDPSYGADWTGSRARFGTVQAGRKFLIAHEYGHALLDKQGNAGFPVNYEVGEDTDSDGSCDVSPTPDVDCESHNDTSSSRCTSNGQHKMWSIEHQSSAANEGWAHFVSADVWNSHDDNADCTFGYWRSKGSSGYNTVAVDCEFGDALYPVQYMRNRCNTNSSWFGTKGVEIDWLRAFWDVHTNGSTHAGMSDMVDWTGKAAAGASDTNALVSLEAASLLASSTLRNDWVNARTDNGL